MFLRSKVTEMVIGLTLAAAFMLAGIISLGVWFGFTLLFKGFCGLSLVAAGVYKLLAFFRYRHLQDDFPKPFPLPPQVSPQSKSAHTKLSV